jgi:hypothetical protein
LYLMFLKEQKKAICCVMPKKINPHITTGVHFVPLKYILWSFPTCFFPGLCCFLYTSVPYGGIIFLTIYWFFLKSVFLKNPGRKWPPFGNKCDETRIHKNWKYEVAAHVLCTSDCIHRLLWHFLTIVYCVIVGSLVTSL